MVMAMMNTPSMIAGDSDFMLMTVSDNDCVRMVTGKRDNRNGDDKESDGNSKDDNRRVEVKKKRRDNGGDEDNDHNASIIETDDKGESQDDGC